MLFCRESNMLSIFYDFRTVKIYLTTRQFNNRIFSLITSAENGVYTVN